MRIALTMMILLGSLNACADVRYVEAAPVDEVIQGDLK